MDIGCSMKNPARAGFSLGPPNRLRVKRSIETFTHVLGFFGLLVLAIESGVAIPPSLTS